MPDWGIPQRAHIAITLTLANSLTQSPLPPLPPLLVRVQEFRAPTAAGQAPAAGRHVEPAVSAPLAPGSASAAARTDSGHRPSCPDLDRVNGCSHTATNRPRPTTRSPCTAGPGSAPAAARNSSGHRHPVRTGAASTAVDKRQTSHAPPPSVTGSRPRWYRMDTNTAAVHERQPPGNNQQRTPVPNDTGSPDAERQVAPAARAPPPPGPALAPASTNLASRHPAETDTASTQFRQRQLTGHVQPIAVSAPPASGPAAIATLDGPDSTPTVSSSRHAVHDPPAPGSDLYTASVSLAADFDKQWPAAEAQQQQRRSAGLAAQLQAHQQPPADGTPEDCPVAANLPPPDLPDPDRLNATTAPDGTTSFGGTAIDGLLPRPAAPPLAWSAATPPEDYRAPLPATPPTDTSNWPTPARRSTDTSTASRNRSHGNLSSTACATRAWNGITQSHNTPDGIVGLLNSQDTAERQQTSGRKPPPRASRGFTGDGLVIQWVDALTWYFGSQYTVLLVPAGRGRELLQYDAFHGAICQQNLHGPNGTGHAVHVSRQDLTTSPVLTSSNGPALIAVFHSGRLETILQAAAVAIDANPASQHPVMAPLQQVIDAYTTRQATPTDKADHVSTVAELATRFSVARRSNGASGDWFATGVFYDDFLFAALAFFSKAVHLVQTAVFRATGTDMADGTVYPASGEHRKQKQDIGAPKAPMSALGLELRSVPEPGLSFPPDKGESVPASGRKIILDAVAAAGASSTPREPGDKANLARLPLSNSVRNGKRRRRQARRDLSPITEGTIMLRWISQVEHLGRADAATLRAANLLRGQLGRGYHHRPRLKLGRRALITMIYIIDRIAKGSGFRHGFPAHILPNLLPGVDTWGPSAPPSADAPAAYCQALPDPPEPDTPGHDTWIISGDAARRPDDESQRRTTDDPCGWGFYIWKYGSATIFHCQGLWRAHEMDSVDITGLEGLTTGFAIEVLKWLCRDQLDKRMDIFHFGDNQSDSEFILNNGGGRADGSRYLGAQRAESLRGTLWRLLSYHQNRRHNTPGDFLSNAKVPAFCRDIRAHFAAVDLDLAVVDLGPLPDAIRNTDGLINHLNSDSPITDDGSLANDLSMLDTITRDVAAAAAAVASDQWQPPPAITARPSANAAIKLGRHDPTVLLGNLGTITAAQLRHAVSVSDFLWDAYSQSDRQRAPYRTWPESDKHMARRPMKLPEVAPPEGRRGIHSNVPAAAAERMAAADVTMCEPPNTGSGAFDDHMCLRAATLLHDLVTQSIDAVERITSIAQSQTELIGWTAADAARAATLPAIIRAAGYLDPTPPPLLHNTPSWRRWADTFRIKLLTACEAVTAATTQCLSILPAVTLLDLFTSSADLDTVKAWVAAYDSAIQRFDSDVSSATDPRSVKFDYDSLPCNRPPAAQWDRHGKPMPNLPATGHNGVFIPAERLANSATLNYFTGPAWSEDSDGSLQVDVDLRLFPVLFENPQHFTELHLASIFEDAAACASVDMPPPDFDHMFEIVFTGFSNYSHAENHLILVPPYTSFFRNWAFIQTKNAQKMRQFAVPRLSPCRRGLLVVPAVLSARGCVDTQTDDKGNIKERQTIDPALHPVGTFGTAWDPGTDPSLNANTHPHHDERIPRLKFFTLEMLSRQVCILDLANVPIVFAKKDAAGYYEQFGRSTMLFHQQVQWVSTQGMQFDTRLVFGFTAEPFTAQRWSFHLNWRTASLLRREQAAWERCWAGLQALGL